MSDTDTNADNVSDPQGLELFLQLWLVWEAAIPPALKSEDPQKLAKLLELCDSEEGISQSKLRRALSLDQPAMSRLSTRIRKTKLITDSIPRPDGRVRLTKLTAAGQKVFHALRSDLTKTKVSYKSPSEQAKEEEEFQAHIDAIFPHWPPPPKARTKRR